MLLGQLLINNFRKDLTLRLWKIENVVKTLIVFFFSYKKFPKMVH